MQKKPVATMAFGFGAKRNDVFIRRNVRSRIKGLNAHMTARHSITPLDRSFGAIVSDIDLRDLSEVEFQALYLDWLEYALLIFPGQRLSNEDQRAFAARFGDLVAGLEAVEISNLLPNGTLRDAPDDDMMKIIRGNMHWHQDNTYMPLQAKGAVFSAKIVPQHNGETAFADMYAAYEALDDRLKEQISDWAAYHSLAHSQAQIGEKTKEKDSEYAGYGLDVEKIPLRPLVKTHPETGRKALAIGRHAFGIPGMPAEKSDELLNALNRFAVSDPIRVYRHRWAKGDVVIWDNRCLMHRACEWDYSEPRVMLHSRIARDPQSEAALY